MKILILGHGRHGKDTVAEFIDAHIGMKFESSSMAAAKIFIYDHLKDKYNYASFEECYEDRSNHRAEWHELISDYNKDDRAKLAKEILKYSDMYVGMRSDLEVQECIKQGVFDLIVGVFHPYLPLEPSDSFNINMEAICDFYIMNNSDLKSLERKTKAFCNIIKYYE